MYKRDITSWASALGGDRKTWSLPSGVQCDLTETAAEVAGPGATEPGAAEPGTTEPGATEPGATEHWGRFLSLPNSWGPL